MNNLLIITWVSCSWKTTLQNELIERGWEKPINFTTRQPRSDREKDEYVFIDSKTFMRKFANGDFIEHTSFNWNYYWVSRCLPHGNTVIVLDPVGRGQIMEKMARAWVDVTTIYLDIPTEVQRERLEERRMSVNDIRARQKDYKWFDKTKFCMEMSWEEDVSLTADKIEYQLNI